MGKAGGAGTREVAAAAAAAAETRDGRGGAAGGAAGAAGGAADTKDWVTGRAGSISSGRGAILRKCGLWAKRFLEKTAEAPGASC